MKNTIVLNLSNVSGKLRAFIAAQVKKNLAALGYNVGDSDNSHNGFSLSVNGDTLEINFNFNNEAQANAFLSSGAHIYNEHQLTDFLDEAERLAKNARSTGTRATEEAGDAAACGVDRVIEREIQGVTVTMCLHGAFIKKTPKNVTGLLNILAGGSSALTSLREQAIRAAKDAGLVPEHAFNIGGVLFH